MLNVALVDFACDGWLNMLWSDLRHRLLRCNRCGHLANFASIRLGLRRVPQYHLQVFLLQLSDLVEDFFICLGWSLSQTIINSLLTSSHLFCDVIQVTLELRHVTLFFSDLVGDGAKFRISLSFLLPRFQLFQLRRKFLIVGFGVGKALLSLLFFNLPHDLFRHLVKFLLFYRS